MKVVTLRVGDDLHARIRAAAEDDHRTLSNWLIVAAIEKLERESKERGE
jgi:predicted transcriptional regulator